ncbi:MAG: hypothetical protein LLF92_02780 [Planctomycetaceae bacterium]|nr:hypothetical protein [Planctomycetaceae bacterium]
MLVPMAGHPNQAVQAVREIQVLLLANLLGSLERISVHLTDNEPEIPIHVQKSVSRTLQLHCRMAAVLIEMKYRSMAIVIQTEIIVPVIHISHTAKDLDMRMIIAGRDTIVMLTADFTIVITDVMTMFVVMLKLFHLRDVGLFLHILADTSLLV